MSKKIYKNINGKQSELTKAEYKEYYSSQPSEEQILQNERSFKMHDLKLHFDSDQIKKTTINIDDKAYQVTNSNKLRSLFLDKFLILQIKISDNLITKEEAIFSYENEDGAIIELSLDDLKTNILFLDESRQLQFREQQKHQKNIKALKTKQEVENYKIK
ncbi:hypothetical protein N9R48_00260 [Rickettsiales bacterium]|nr:hypothetical protein [Rickettsiales bacterium]